MMEHFSHQSNTFHNKAEWFNDKPFNNFLHLILLLFSLRIVYLVKCTLSEASALHHPIDSLQWFRPPGVLCKCRLLSVFIP